ncbi:jupiter microtubule associated homolog 2 isoform X2 [Nerophis lumbriciformis]|uniref:jupiter microtubule associated homolog 2 isoform X2 n=1 Tax=Nerophis lumbriciformis TaxID=546530 RepID=UPI002ADFAC8B|nr:jupiter microtubule associated homolog 2-like isoform X2 [Nerophis lumbriciformis]
MTSTNMFQGLATGSKPSSRVLQPPGGGSSDLFGSYEEKAPQSRRLNKMASNVFASPEEPQTVPRRSNPPGGKSSGIFGEPEPPVHQQRPGAPTSSILASPDHAAPQSPSEAHPNKPKDNLTVRPEAESPVCPSGLWPACLFSPQMYFILKHPRWRSSRPRSKSNVCRRPRKTLPLLLSSLMLPLPQSPPPPPPQALMITP